MKRTCLQEPQTPMRMSAYEFHPTIKKTNHLRIKFFKIIILVLFVAFSASCSKNSDDSTVVGDAIVVAKKSGANTVYAMAYYAYAYSPLKSVIVESMVDPSNQAALVSNGLYTSNFIKEPTDADFSTTKPSADTFTFSAVFETGSTYKTEDAITADILAPATIEKCTYNSTKSYAELSWTAVTNADSYGITVFDDSGAIVFKTGELANTVTSGNLSTSETGWTTGHPVSGKTYKIRVQAFQYEDSANPNSYHIQSTSYAEASIVWG